MKNPCKNGLIAIIIFHFLTLVFLTEKEDSGIPPLQESKFGDKNFIKE